MRKKEKIMTAIAMAAEGLAVASEVVGTIRKRSAMARKSAEKAVSNLRDNTADVAEQLVDTVNEQLSMRPSAGTRAWQFAAGLGVGVGAGLLFAPMPGAKVRANLYKAVTRSSRATEDAARTDWS